jgi:hypothetical protein
MMSGGTSGTEHGDVPRRLGHLHGVAPGCDDDDVQTRGEERGVQ